MQNIPHFAYFIAKFILLCLTIFSKSIGSETLLQHSMGSTEAMEPMLTQPLGHLATPSPLIWSMWLLNDPISYSLNEGTSIKDVQQPTFAYTGLLNKPYENEDIHP